MKADIDDALHWAGEHERETIILVINAETTKTVTVSELRAIRDQPCWGCVSHCKSGDWKAQGTVKAEGWPDQWTSMGWAKTSDAAIAAFIADYQKRLADYERQATEPEYALRVALKAHDWWYCMSDCGRTYNEGRRSEARVHELAGKVPAEKAKELWAELAPEQFEFPL